MLSLQRLTQAACAHPAVHKVVFNRSLDHLFPNRALRCYASSTPNGFDRIIARIRNVTPGEIVVTHVGAFTLGFFLYDLVNGTRC